MQRFPRYIWVLVAIYCAASLLHFAHNAEYLAFYPNMPRSITRETVYLAWLAITLPGVLGIALASIGWRALGAACLAAYGAFGLDGLGHYTLALCSQHTFAMNFSIWFEAVAGLALALAAAILCKRMIWYGRMA